MKPSTFALVLLLAPAARAQVTELWSSTYDAPTAQADYGLKVTTDLAGNVYVTGRSLNPSLGIPPAPPTQDTITLKYDASGTLLWERRFDGYGGDDNGRDVAVDPADGSVYSVGHSQGLVGGVYVTDIRVIKYDADGAELWTAAYDGPGASADFARAVRVDSQGDVLVGGYAYNALGDTDGLVLRYDSAGLLLAETFVGGSAGAGDAFATLELGADGSIYAVGQANSGAGPSLLVAKISAAGSVLWQQEFDGGGSDVEYALGLAVDAAGAVHVAGYASTVSGGRDAALLKYDAAGNLAWSRTIDGAAHTIDQGLEVALDAAGNVFLAGYLNQGGASKIDYLLAKHDPAGNVLWQHTWDGPAHQDDVGQYLVVDAGGSPTITGYSTGAGGLNDVDIVTIRYDGLGAVRWTHVSSSAGIDYDRPYDLAATATGRLVVTGAVRGATQHLTDVVTFELGDQAQRFCFGDGVLASCPCANASTPGEQRGCTNSAGASAALVDTGFASLAGDTLVLTSSGELPSALSIFLQGTSTNSAVTFGDGLRCVGGSLKRLYVKNAVGGVASAPGVGDPSVSQRSAALGDPLSAGTRRYLQTYYRDPDLGFCAAPPGNSWNISSGLILDWGP